jgi:2-C-methyl-D-erythritol 4-phosphate cytidylyltransferase
MREVCAVVLAAGRGKRMGAVLNKQFLCIKEKPILYYTLKAFEDCALIDNIVLVTAENEMDYCREEIVRKYNITKITAIVAGGAERQNSVFKGLIAANDSDIVLIHDGARPFVDETIIRNGIEYARKYGACACGITPKDTIKQKSAEGFSVGTLERSSLFSVQTPQCFKLDLILGCHKKISDMNVLFTDDTSVVEYLGHRVYLYEGSYNNIKITTPEDLVIGEKILESITV